MRRAFLLLVSGFVGGTPAALHALLLALAVRKYCLRASVAPAAPQGRCGGVVVARWAVGARSGRPDVVGTVYVRHSFAQNSLSGALQALMRL